MMVIAQAQKIVPKKGFRINKKPTETINKNSKKVRDSNFCCMALILRDFGTMENLIMGSLIMESQTNDGRLYGSDQGVSSTRIAHLGKPAIRQTSRYLLCWNHFDNNSGNDQVWVTCGYYFVHYRSVRSSAGGFGFSDQAISPARRSWAWKAK